MTLAVIKLMAVLCAGTSVPIYCQKELASCILEKKVMSQDAALLICIAERGTKK